ncbi:flagellar basal body-associated protein FliL [Yersinia bercovieri]|uniref:flagellar basal body-associated protein FliL n=1 Tax=Yersinia bercovieri TaxID=634 RepID=UPI0011A06FF7|nr:flagellar basal body-associated protein FliL [Yersinia bercovieri]
MTKNNTKIAKGGKKSSLVILFMMLITIGACALAGYTFYEMNNIKAHVSGDNNDTVATPISEPIIPLYIQMDTFTVSLKPTPTDDGRVLHIGLTLRVKDENSKVLIEKFLPEVRSRLLILLAQQTAENISADKGKQQLIEKIKSVVSEPLTPNQSVVITDVLFNAFILR